MFVTKYMNNVSSCSDLGLIRISILPKNLFKFQTFHNILYFIFDRLKQLSNDMHQKYSKLLSMQLKMRNLIIKQKQYIKLIKTSNEL